MSRLFSFYNVAAGMFQVMCEMTQ